MTAKKPYSTDRNLFHMSFEGGILEDPWAAPPSDMFVLTTSPEEAPDQRDLRRDRVRPGRSRWRSTARSMSPAEILVHLNKVGGENGIGRVDMVENRYVGIKSRGVYETPGGTILHAAHRAVESITMDREVMYLRDGLIPTYTRLVYFGYWFSPEREMLQKAVDESQKNVSGHVRFDLYKGNVRRLRPEVGTHALSRGICHLRRGRGLLPARRHRFHPPQRPEAPDQGPHGHRMT